MSNRGGKRENAGRPVRDVCAPHLIGAGHQHASE